MSKKVLFFVLFLLVLPVMAVPAARAQETQALDPAEAEVKEPAEKGMQESMETKAEVSIKVEEMVFTTAIMDREPAGSELSFPKTTEKVYCFTRLVGVTEPTTVSHVWYFNDEEMARIELAVSGSPWRTWSAKTMQRIWAGKWRVEIISAEGNLLAKKEFELTSVVE